jgi:hypothetical protein
MKLDDNAVVNAVAKLAKVSDLIEQWHKEAFDRYAWEVEYQQRGGDMRELSMAREVREKLEQCVTEMRAIVGWPWRHDGAPSCHGMSAAGPTPTHGDFPLCVGASEIANTAKPLDQR